MITSTRRWATMALFAAACTTAHAKAPAPKAAQPAVAPVAKRAEVRKTRAEFDQLYARYLKLADGPEKRALADEVDAAAAQKYAHVSGLYWHTDLEAAKAAAKASGKPILSLRLLGRLDEEYSCINSRFFRVALYANEKVAALLAKDFVLHWSSERPVPKVTIDMGDGRQIVRTLAGNSAHYVLDAEGRPVDVLPGLYAPGTFVRELEAIRPVAVKVAAQKGDERMKTLRAFHQERGKAALELLQKSGGWGIRVTINGGIPIGPETGSGQMPNGPQVMIAEQRTVSKASTEVGFARSVILGETRTADATWVWAAYAQSYTEDARLDARSRALIQRLQPTDWTAAAAPLEGQSFDRLVEIFEGRIAMDTAMNELELRRMVHAWFEAGDAQITASFAALNDQVYRTMYATPADDPWLGLGSPTVFTALPRDGVQPAPVKQAVVKAARYFLQVMS